MEEKKRKTLRSVYNSACNNYLEAFAKKHGFDMSDCGWVADDPGGVATLGDYYTDMATIITDIDMNAAEEEWLKWYDYSAECHELNLPVCNFNSWLMGCPRHSKETIERLHTLRKEVQDAEIRLRQAIEEEKNKLR